MIYICENPTIKSIILCVDFKIINIYKYIGNKAKSTELGKEWGLLKRQDLEWEWGRETKQLETAGTVPLSGSHLWPWESPWFVTGFLKHLLVTHTLLPGSLGGVALLFLISLGSVHQYSLFSNLPHTCLGASCGVSWAGWSLGLGLHFLPSRLCL